MAGAPRATRWTRRFARSIAPRAGNAGLTLIELVVAFSLMLILSTMALPVARVKVQREKERRLRTALVEIRQAVDRYKDMADQGRLGEIDPDNHGYPRSLDALVDGVAVAEEAGGLPMSGAATSAQGIGLGSSRALGTRPNPMGGIGSLGSSGSQIGAGGTSSGAFDRLVEDPLAPDDGKPESIRFLRSIPVDPMTGRREWGLLSVSDNPDGRSWSGRNVFDVYSLSAGIALDGTRYSEW